MLSWKRTRTASALLILGTLAMQYFSQVEDVHPNRPFSEFPKEIGPWKGAETRFSEKVYEVLGVDDSFLGHYRKPDGSYVQLYIGFYQSQREGDLIHSPKNCMPGGGWTITQTSLHPVSTAPGHSEKADVIRLDLRNGEQKQLVLYWFHSRGRIIASEYLQKIYLVTDSVFRHRTDGSFVRLIAPVNGDEEEKTLENLTDFAETILPVLNDFIPS